MKRRSRAGTRLRAAEPGKARARVPLWPAVVVAALALVGGRAHPATAVPPNPFVEVAAQSGLDFVHFNGMSGELHIAEIMGGGAALLDYDNDGDLDVFFAQGRMLGADVSIGDALIPPQHPLPLTGRLYRNELAFDAEGRRALRFSDVTTEAIPPSIGYGMGVAAADYDGDGWVDLYVNNYGPNQMLRNNGDGSFSDSTEFSGVGDERWSVSAAFFDFDRDGWLDLYVGNYLDYDLGSRPDCAAVTGAPDYCSPLNYSPRKDALFRNLGDGSFRNESVTAGIETAFGPALGVVAADFSEDGWLDVYVANDATENQLWINQTDGTFVNEAVLSGCAVNEAGIPEGSMGVAVADFDGNELLDLFMTHIAQETNTLFLSSGGGVFREATRRSRLGVASRSSTGFGTAAIDFDNDGWQDLFIANGTVQKIAALTAEGDPYPLRQPDSLFHNGGGAAFEQISTGADFGGSHVSRGVAVGDLDRDGDEDLVIVDSAGPARLLRNDLQSAEAAWLGLRVGMGWGPFRDALGTKAVVATGEGRRLVRRIATDGSYASAAAPELVVGGGTAEFDSLTVEWPSGETTTWKDPPAHRRLTVARHALELD